MFDSWHTDFTIMVLVNIFHPNAVSFLSSQSHQPIIFWLRYLDEQNTSHLYFGCSTYLFFFVTVFMRDTHLLALETVNWAYLDKFRGTFRWHICFNFVVLRMISFGYDYHWALVRLLFFC